MNTRESAALVSQFQRVSCLIKAATKVDHHEVGTKVKWNHGDGTAEGKVVEVHKKPVEKTIKKTKVKRNASSENPAYLIEQEGGNQALKSHSEVYAG